MEYVSLERKNLNDVEMFKSEIRKWEAWQCECKLRAICAQYRLYQYQKQ